MIRRQFPILLAMLALAGPFPLRAEQTAAVLRDTELRSEPFNDASVTTTLSAKSPLTLLKRQGGWYQARHGTQLGWVRMSAIRLGDAQAGGNSGIGDTLRFLNSGRSGASGVTVATGIRGLDAADVANASPDHQAVKSLGRLQVTSAQARAFAADAKLKSSQLAYLRAQDKKNESGIPGLGED
jgi:hypothetical protein